MSIRLVLWAGLLLALMATAMLDTYARRGTLAGVFEGVPWFWMSLALLLAGVLYRAATARPSPEIIAILDQVGKDRATCRHCRGPLGPQDMVCRSCRRLVFHTGTTVGALVGLLLCLFLFVRILWRAFGE